MSSRYGPSGNKLKAKNVLKKRQKRPQREKNKKMKNVLKMRYGPSGKKVKSWKTSSKSVTVFLNKRDSYITFSPILQSSCFGQVFCFILASSQQKLCGYIEFLKFDVTIKKNLIQIRLKLTHIAP